MKPIQPIPFTNKKSKATTTKVKATITSPDLSSIKPKKLDNNWDGTFAPAIVSQKIIPKNKSIIGMPYRLEVSILSNFLSLSLVQYSNIFLFTFKHYIAFFNSCF